MGFQVLMDLCEEKLWLVWNLHGPRDGRKLICLVFVHFTKMAALKKSCVSAIVMPMPVF